MQAPPGHFQHTGNVIYNVVHCSLVPKKLAVSVVDVSVKTSGQHLNEPHVLGL